MRLFKTYIKRDLHVSLTKLSDDEIQQKIQRKALKICCKAITDHIPRPVTVKANPAAARKYVFKLTRYGVRCKNHKTIIIYVWQKNAMLYSRVYENGMITTVAAIQD